MAHVEDVVAVDKLREAADHVINNTAGVISSASQRSHKQVSLLGIAAKLPDTNIVVYFSDKDVTLDLETGTCLDASSE